jgi:protein TonB
MPLAAQNEPASQETVTTNTPPTYPGGEQAYKKFVQKNLKYPDYCRQFEAEGVCTMAFIVNADGTIGEIEAKNCKVTHINYAKLEKYTAEERKNIKKECSRQMAKEGLRIIRKMKNWNPARLNGKAIPSTVTQDLDFKIDYVDD